MYVYSNKLKIRSHDANHDKVEIFFLEGGGVLWMKYTAYKKD